MQAKNLKVGLVIEHKLTGSVVTVLGVYSDRCRVTGWRDTLGRNREWVFLKTYTTKSHQRPNARTTPEREGCDTLKYWRIVKD